MQRYDALLHEALGDGSTEIEGRPVSLQFVRLSPPHAVLRRVSARQAYQVRHAWAVATAQKLRRSNADVLHLTDGNWAYLSRWFPPETAVVVTAHDVIPYLQMTGRIGPDRPWLLPRLAIKASAAALRKVNHVVTVSRHSAHDLQETVGVDGEAISVVPLPLGLGRASPADYRDQRSYLCGPQTILHVGSDAYYKNRGGVVSVFARLRLDKPVRLVLAGAPPSAALRGRVRSLGLDDAVEYVVHPDDDRLQQLYRRASLLLFPSWYEGFGWPPLEAMANGCPVVCSSAASLPEVVGIAALTAPADDVEGLAVHCRRVLGDSDFAYRLSQEGLRQAATFSISRFRDGTSAAYGAALNQRNPTSR